MVHFSFYLIISSAGMWKEQNLYSYNIVSNAPNQPSIQYFSNESPHVFHDNHAGVLGINVFYSSSPLTTLNYPLGRYDALNDEGLTKSLNLFSQISNSKSQEIHLKSEINSKHQACAQQLASARKNGFIGISNIMKGLIHDCNINSLINLIDSKQIRIGESERDCNEKSQEICIVGDVNVPAQLMKDPFQPIMAATRNGKKSYLVTYDGNLKVMLQTSGNRYIIVPKLGGWQNNDIYWFLLLTEKKRVAKNNLDSAVIDLRASSTDKGATIFKQYCA